MKELRRLAILILQEASLLARFGDIGEVDYLTRQFYNEAFWAGWQMAANSPYDRVPLDYAYADPMRAVIWGIAERMFADYEAELERRGYSHSGSKLRGPHDRRVIHRYDTLWLRPATVPNHMAPPRLATDIAQRTSLFQGLNVGWILATNMEVAGSMPGDHTFAVTHVRVCANFKRNEHVMLQALERLGLWDFIVAEHTQRNGHMEVGLWWPVEGLIPPRQTFRLVAELNGELQDMINAYKHAGFIRFELHGVESRDVL